MLCSTSNIIFKSFTCDRILSDIGLVWRQYNFLHFCMRVCFSNITTRRVIKLYFSWILFSIITIACIDNWANLSICRVFHFAWNCESKSAYLKTTIKLIFILYFITSHHNYMHPNFVLNLVNHRNVISFIFAWNFEFSKSLIQNATAVFCLKLKFFLY